MLPTPFDHALVALIAIGYPMRGLLAMRGRLRSVPDAELPAARVRLYQSAMAAQWLSTLSIVIVWAALRRPWSMLGLIPVWGGGMLGVLFGLVVVVVVVLRRGMDERAASALRTRMDGIERMLPHGVRELRWFSLLSITAGLCEEFLYRGYILWYLQALGLPLLPAAGVSCIAFGLGHLYQGARGVLTTTLVGAFLSGVYLLSGSLFAGMLIHALMDLHSGRTLYALYSREAEA